jgi:hypothetical protein
MAALGKLLRQLAGLWLGLGFPAACLASLFEYRRHWMGNHPYLAVAAIVSVVGPLITVGWLEYSRKKSERC